VLLTALLSSGAASPQDRFPAKVVRILTASPGSNHDWGARITANELSNRWRERAIVENRGSISVEYMVREVVPDGHTILFYGAFVWFQPLLQKVSWDPITDLSPVILAMSSPTILVVHPALPVRSTKELIALARVRPDELNYSAGGGGSTPHIAAELLKHLANVKIQRVLYKGSGPSMLGLLTGEVQMMFSALGPTLPYVKQGKMRAIAVSSPKRSKLIPELPPVADVVPGFAAESALGFFVPRKTPAAIVSLLNKEIAAALRAVDPQIFINAGIEFVGGTPDDFLSFIRADIARMAPVIRGAGFSS
jgi:tripartite-type tricarboxylate transporter receptor subunit TctC